MNAHRMRAVEPDHAASCPDMPSEITNLFYTNVMSLEFVRDLFCLHQM
eukprot:UN16482